MIRRLPLYVTSFLSQNGRVRYRYRRRGHPSHYFRSRFGTKAFRDEYAACLAGTPPKDEPEHRAPRPKPNKPEQTPMVYFIGGPSGPIKIGFSTAPKKRLHSLQTTSPYHLKILLSVPGSVELERALHARFAHLRLRGEWFRREPEIMDEIARMKREYVSPVCLTSC